MVLHVFPALQTGGAERGCVDIAVAVMEAGGTAFVASSGGDMVRDLDRVGARHFKMPVHSKNPLRMWLNSRRLIKIIREFWNSMEVEVVGNYKDSMLGSEFFFD